MSGGGLITAIIGTAWGIASDIVGWFHYAEQRSRRDRLESRTVYLDQRLADDFAESLIYRLDVWKNIERAIRAWKQEIAATERALAFMVETGNPKVDRMVDAITGQSAQRTTTEDTGALDARLRATVAWWLDCVPLRLSDPMPSYRDIPPPAGQVGGGLDIRDDGWYAAQGRYVLPSLGRSGYPDRPLIPSWAAIAAGVVAPHPVIYGAAVLSQVVRVSTGPHRKTVMEWLSPREDARDLLRRHHEHWERYRKLDIDWADGDGPGRPTKGEVAPGMWALRGTWTLANSRDVIATLNPRPFQEYLPPPTWSELRVRLDRIGVRMTSTGALPPRVEERGERLFWRGAR